MASGKLDLEKDLPFGTLNPIEDKNVAHSGDRRRTSSLDALNATTSRAYGISTLQTIQRFKGIVVHRRTITMPRYANRMDLLQAYVATNLEGTADQGAVQTRDKDRKVGPFRNSGRVAYKVYIPELEPRPAPRGPDDPVLKTYPDIFPAPGREDLSALPIGSVVEVEFEDRHRMFGPQIVEGNKEDFVLLDGFGAIQSDLESQFAEGVPGILGESRSDNVIFTTLLPGATEIGATQEIVSSPPFPTSLTATVERELSFWRGKKECESEETKARLNVYWRNIGEDGTNQCEERAWSAAFISYVVMKNDSTFGGAPAHTTYASNSKEGRGGWTLWKAQPGIKAQLGDILIYPNPKGPEWASHGDVVYKVQNNKAYLAGGNLSDTAKGGAPGDTKDSGYNYLTLDLDAQGYYSSFASYGTNTYAVVLKKNGKVQNREGVVV